MTSDPTDSEVKKELESLTNLFPKNKSMVALEKMEQKEARAILGYITYLENMVAESIDASKRGTSKKEYNQQNLDTGLRKLVGMAAGMQTSDQNKALQKIAGIHEGSGTCVRDKEDRV